MHELQRRVESLVRPLSASHWRKNRMREELLQHLTESSEAKQKPGETDGRANAMEQLGDVATLRRELQAAVPAVEQFLFRRLGWADVLDRWFDREQGESRFRYALQRTAYATAFLSVMMLAIFLALELANRLEILPRSVMNVAAAPAKLALVAVSVLALQALATGLIHYLADVWGVRRVLSRTSDSGVARKALAMCQIGLGYLVLFLTPVLLFVILVLNAPVFSDIASGAPGWLGWLAVGILMLLPLVMLYTGWSLQREHEQYENWGRLEIDE